LTDLSQQISEFGDQRLSIAKVTGDHRCEERVAVQPLNGEGMTEGRSYLG
jgi:hypothetical protein